jgi:hypothetical protein
MGLVIWLGFAFLILCLLALVLVLVWTALWRERMRR